MFFLIKNIMSRCLKFTSIFFLINQLIVERLPTVKIHIKKFHEFSDFIRSLQQLKCLYNKSFNRAHLKSIWITFAPTVFWISISKLEPKSELSSKQRVKLYLTMVFRVARNDPFQVCYWSSFSEAWVPIGQDRSSSTPNTLLSLFFLTCWNAELSVEVTSASTLVSCR